jgi:hypothetical protein
MYLYSTAAIAFCLALLARAVQVLIRDSGLTQSQSHPPPDPVIPSTITLAAVVALAVDKLTISQVTLINY